MWLGCSVQGKTRAIVTQGVDFTSTSFCKDRVVCPYGTIRAYQKIIELHGVGGLSLFFLHLTMNETTKKAKVITAQGIERLFANVFHGFRYLLNFLEELSMSVDFTGEFSWKLATDFQGYICNQNLEITFFKKVLVLSPKTCIIGCGKRGQPRLIVLNWGLFGFRADNPFSLWKGESLTCKELCYLSILKILT